MIMPIWNPFTLFVKKEEVNHVRDLDFQSAQLALFQYIEG